MKMKSILSVTTVLLLVTSAFAMLISNMQLAYPEQPTSKMWLDPPFVDIAGKSVSYRFNVTAMASIDVPSFAWELDLYYDPAFLTVTGVGYTGGGTSEFFEGHSTCPCAPLFIDKEFGEVLTGESLEGDDRAGAGNGSLCWVEFELVAPVNSTKLIINNTGTYFLDPDLLLMDCERYDSYVGTRARVPTFDLNGDGRVDITDIAVAAQSFGSNPTRSRWNPDADVNGDGRVDITDIALIAKNFGKHFP